MTRLQDDRVRSSSERGDHRLLPRHRRHQDNALSTKVEKIVSAVELDAVAGATAGGDPAALRGVPVVGGGGDAIRGTKPGANLV
jgi:hypothetical protein